MYKYELHLHTSEGDLCAFSSGAECVRLYHDAGYAGMVVTNHYFSTFFDWFADELRGKDHRGIIDRFLRGYYNARNEGERLGFTVLAGAEVRFADSVNDYLIYGVDEEFFYNAPLLNRLGGLRELAEILPKEALIVQAHPFRDGMDVRKPDHLFGIEGYNGGNESIRNELARIYATHYGKPMTSGSDFHCSDHLARGGISTSRKITTASDLSEVLRSGDYEIIER
ncbi:MAG: hypothetical protein IJC50_08755 [Clostridia bacterium]|nr:hypothetical protein [Clostridia bacterium]